MLTLFSYLFDIILFFAGIHRNPQPPLPVPSLDRGTRASDYATTAFSVPNLSRSERGSDSSSKSRSSYRPNSSAPNVDLSQPLHRPPLPPRLVTFCLSIASKVYEYLFCLELKKILIDV